MANILYYPQISMYDKQTKILLPQADGNINMMRNTINEWKKHRPNDNFYVLIPKGVFFPYHIDLKINCQFFTYDSYTVSARINRFNFPMNEFSSILKSYKFDLVISDVIEVTGNFKQMFNIEFGYAPKIISNIRHLDDSLNKSYMYRVLEGIEQSDLVTILSDTMKIKLRHQLIDLVRFEYANKLSDKVITFEPSISHAEIEPYTRNAVIKEAGKVRITFPGRLSIGEERRTNWDKFIEAIQKLRDKRDDFEVYLTDPNNGASWNIGGEIKTIDKDRRLFLNLLNQTDIVVSLMDIEGFGGISIREALLFNCMPIIPLAHEYKKMVPSDYPGFVQSPINVSDLASAINWAIDKIKEGKKNIVWNKNLNYVEYGMQFTVEKQFKKLLPKIEGLLNG